MSVIETIVDIPVEHSRNVFGSFDEYVKKIEKTLHVTIILRESELKIIGDESSTKRASSVINELIALSKKGNIITEQNVDYAIALSMDDKVQALTEIDGDIVCRTINGKPVKPKTLGQ